MSNFTNSLKGGAKYLFLTDNRNGQNVYSTFGDDWEEFVEAVSSS